MASNSWTPNFIIGIDFGMTCTGVAYSSAPEWPAPRVLQHWPGGSHLENKVPTQVGYDVNGNRKNWGFECNIDDPTTIVKEWFKLYLNPGFHDEYPGRPTRDQAIEYYQDFMSYLREHIESHFSTVLGARWLSKKVEYVFSIPTTWKDPTLTAEMQGWLENAGFENSSTRKLNISRTEAECAAVYAAKQSEENDVVMVVDMGGGTTDINILKVQSRTQRSTRMIALDKAEGIDAGSSWIDQKVEQLIRDQISAITGAQTTEGRNEAARRIMKGQFEAFKKAFGRPGTQIEQLEMSETRARGRPLLALDRPVVITSIQLKSLFDEQIAKVFDMVDNKMQDLQARLPNERIQYLVLSGGLGNSKYVQDELQAQYGRTPAPFPNARELSILPAEEPQRAVVEGLVMDRIQSLRSGFGVYTQMCCRVSYGVLCRLPYNDLDHIGETVTIDPLDKKKWAEEQIDWLIKEGEPVPLTGRKRPYHFKIPAGKESETLRAYFYMSERPAAELPRSLRFGNAKKICTVFARFDQNDFKNGTSIFKLKREKREGLFNKRRQYYEASFDVNVLVGSTDVKFQILAKDGRPYMLGDHEPIHVDWEEAAAPQVAGMDMRTMYPQPTTPARRRRR